LWIIPHHWCPVTTRRSFLGFLSVPFAASLTLPKFGATPARASRPLMPADLVPLDANNRVLVHQGLRRIRAGRSLPGIRALLEAAGKAPERVIAADLGFRYAGDRPPALDGLDLRLPAGGRVAILGATGAGKSTLTNLLLRFWERQTGEVLLGGHDLRAFQGEDVRRLIGVVSQRTHLFNTRIRDNLLLANPDASQGAIEQACRTAQIHDFIAT